jgi:hypothetical protein
MLSTVCKVGWWFVMVLHAFKNQGLLSLPTGAAVFLTMCENLEIYLFYLCFRIQTKLMKKQ